MKLLYLLLICTINTTLFSMTNEDQEPSDYNESYTESSTEYNKYIDRLKSQRKLQQKKGSCSNVASSMCCGCCLLAGIGIIATETGVMISNQNIETEHPMVFGAIGGSIITAIVCGIGIGGYHFLKRLEKYCTSAKNRN